MSTTTTITTEETSHYQKGQHYTELPSTLKYAPPVIVFFSFLNKTSYEWATKDQVVSTIRQHVPNGTTIARYHLADSNLTDFSRELTHSWAVAHELHVDDRVIQPLFEAIHGPTKAVDIQGVKAVFDQAGIPPLRFDREYGKLSVHKEVEWMEEAASRLGIRQAPAIVVAGKYLLNTEAFGPGVNPEKIADVVKELLELKK